MIGSFIVFVFRIVLPATANCIRGYCLLTVTTRQFLTGDIIMLAMANNLVPLSFYLAGLLFVEVESVFFSFFSIRY